MPARLFLPIVFALFVVDPAVAQNRFRWRPGSIVGGIADRIGSAVRERKEPELDPELAEATPIVAADGTVHHHHQHHPTHHHRGSSQTVPPPRTTLPRTSSPPQRPIPQPATRAVSTDEVIEMVHRGLPESTIMQYVAENGLRQPLNVTDLIRLHEQGVSEPIINVMQAAHVASPQAYRQPVLRQPASPPVRTRPLSLPPPPPTADVGKYGPSILSP